MNQNIRVAKQLVRLAKELIAEGNEIVLFDIATDPANVKTSSRMASRRIRRAAAEIPWMNNPFSTAIQKLKDLFASFFQNEDDTVDNVEQRVERAVDKFNDALFSYHQKTCVGIRKFLEGCPNIEIDDARTGQGIFFIKNTLSGQEGIIRYFLYYMKAELENGKVVIKPKSEGLSDKIIKFAKFQGNDGSKAESISFGSIDEMVRALKNNPFFK